MCCVISFLYLEKHSKTHSVQDMWKDDVSAEKASMNSHDPMGYSYAEDQRIKRRDKKGRQVCHIY